MRRWHDWLIGLALVGLVAVGIFALWGPEIAELIDGDSASQFDRQSAAGGGIAL